MQIDRNALTELVSQVIREYKRKEGSPQKRALVVLEGIVSEEFFNSAVIQFSSQYELTFFVTGACCRQRLASFGDIIEGEQSQRAVRETIMKFDAVILAEPSISTISKLAHVVIDSAIVELVFASLEAQIPVMLGPVCQTKAYTVLTPCLRKEIDMLAKKVITFGAREWTNLPEVETNYKYQQPTTKRQVITLDEIVKLTTAQNEFVAASGIVLTPLALDYLSEKKIPIRRVSS